MASRSIEVWNVVTDTRCTLLRIDTIGDVKSGIAHSFDVQSEKQLLVSSDRHKLLLDNALLLNTQPEITVIKIYTKITPPRPIDIKIVPVDTLDGHNLTVWSDQSVATLRKQIDGLLGLSPYQRCLTTLQTVMLNDDQMWEYLLAPLPEGQKQVILVDEEEIDT